MAASTNRARAPGAFLPGPLTAVACPCAAGAGAMHAPRRGMRRSVPLVVLLSGVWAASSACEPVRDGPSAPASRGFYATSRDAGGASSDAGTSSLVAPGAPGQPQTWPPARKSLLGRAKGGSSRVYFTGYRGSVSEVFYPRPDAVQSTALELLVGDAEGRHVQVESELPYVSMRPEPRSMRWRVSTEAADHGWRLTKDVFTDPERDALVVVAELSAGAGQTLGDYRLYVFHDPALLGTGAEDASRLRHAHGRLFLVASEGDRASALGVSVPWARRAGGGAVVSNAFSGAPGSRADLLDDAGLGGTFETAAAGNVEQLGEIALGDGRARRFAVVLGFGGSEQEAMDAAAGVLDDDWDALARRYDDGWRGYTDSLDTQAGLADDRYYLAAMTLESMRDEASGAMVAGLGTPWGPSRGDDDNGGYHLVWPRDLFKFSNALITAGDLPAALGAVRYLFGTLVQTRSCGASEASAAGCPGGYSRVGRFPQNAWIDTKPYWTSTQLDEQAMPIALAWRVYERGDADTRAEIARLWPRIRSTAEYILETGPWTPQERWEETSGYSPSTIAAEIAGLVAAAELARTQGDTASAARYLSVADQWEDRVAAWTFTSTGPYGDHRYYIRLNPSRMRGGTGPDRFEPIAGPDEPTPIGVNNGGGVHDQREIVDGGFLELVRMGVKAATDPTIVGSLHEYDAILKQALARGDDWFRYNFDGYGEANDGAGWAGTNGHGRLWPIFTAERGLFEIARAASGAAGEPYLGMLRAFATPEGFIPEQIWGQSAVITGVKVETPPGREPGTPTDSIAPLSWAMGEYMTLLASVRAGRVVDIPQSVCRRYDTCDAPARPGEVEVVLEIAAPTRPGERVYVVAGASGLRDEPALGAPAHVVGDGRWRAVVELPASTEVDYTPYLRHADGSWERDGGARRRLRVPADGSLSLELLSRFGSASR